MGTAGKKISGLDGRNAGTRIRDLHFGKNQAIMTKECKRLHRVDVEESYDCKAVTESWWVV